MGGASAARRFTKGPKCWVSDVFERAASQDLAAPAGAQGRADTLMQEWSSGPWAGSPPSVALEAWGALPLPDRIPVDSLRKAS
eukprot:9986425-Lingulodinium_polyedra.AAC.1